jgi:hypothetical protein
MLKIIAYSLGSLVSANKIPSTTGNFFYSDIDAGSTHRSTLKSIHSVDTYVGSNKQKFKLTLNPDLQALTVFKVGGANFSTLSNTYYDPNTSTTSVQDPSLEETKAKINFIGGYHLNTTDIYGTKYTDNVYFKVN